MRQVVIRMETFGAKPSTPLAACRAEVEQSDALIVIIGHRFGWVPSLTAASAHWLNSLVFLSGGLLSLEQEVGSGCVAIDQVPRLGHSAQTRRQENGAAKGAPRPVIKTNPEAGFYNPCDLIHHR